MFDRTDAFTVIEILIVIVIIAISAMMTIPMMSSADTIQLRSASNMIAADLEYAKSMAISRQQDYSVVFDASSDSYEIRDSSGIVISHPVKKGSNYVVTFNRASNLDMVDIVTSGVTVTFDSLGSPQNADTITLGSHGDADGEKIVNVNVEAVTGFISITN